MFLDKTSKKIKGYLEVTVFGFFIERFLNLAKKAEINVWNVKKIDDATVSFQTDIKGYKKLIPIAAKTGCKMNVSKKAGIPFFILKHKKRKTYPILFLLLIIGVYFYQLHIWNINIVGDFTFPIEEIKDELEMENVKIGTLKKSMDINYIKNNIYMRRHDIAWIGISIKGIDCTVEVVEANLKKDESELDKVPCNVVSDKDGMICSINTLEGTPMVQSGDMVKSGDILISGIMKSEWSPDRYVNSKGEVYIKTWHTSKEIVQLERDIISKTGKTNSHYLLKIQNYQINFGNNDTKFEKYDTIETENKLNLFGLIDLPILLRTTTYHEIDVETVKYTEKQAIDVALKKLENETLKQIDSNAKVINKEINTIKNDNNITIVLTIECIEKTGIKKKLEG